MKRRHPGEPPADPFGERRRGALRLRARLLGAEFCFETDSGELLRLVRRAFDGLPAARLAPGAPRLTVKLVLTPGARVSAAQPPGLIPLATDGILCGGLAGSSFAAIVPAERRALIAVPRALLRHPYHVRYELIEFAAYMLAARTQELLPLHAGCVALNGRGALILGDSGAGKSTLALQALLAGFDFLAEDSVLVQPRRLLASGLANFLHVHADSLRFLPPRIARSLAGAPVIRRRSGVEKLEIDLRVPSYRLARPPLPLAALVFLSRAPAGGGPLLRRLDAPAAARRLSQGQRYAAQQPRWREFLAAARALPALELRRGVPKRAVAELAELLCAPRR